MEKASGSEPTKTSVVSGGRKKNLYTFPDRTELVEEYDVNTLELVVRKWKKPRDIGEGEWIYEVGDATKAFNPDSDLLAPNASNPIFLRKDTPKEFQWRIRNLKYPKEVYILEIDHEKQQIVVKTTIKKYYKRFEITDLKRAKIGLNEADLKWTYQNQTLLISYKKPEAIIKEEQKKRKELMIEIQEKGKEDGNVDCKPQ